MWFSFEAITAVSLSGLDVVRQEELAVETGAQLLAPLGESWRGLAGEWQWTPGPLRS